MVKISPSPCATCKCKVALCSRGNCEKFNIWVKESWPVVVKGMRRLQRSRRVPAKAKDPPFKEESNRGRKARAVIAVCEGAEAIKYKSVPFAANQLHIATSMIYNAINGKVKTAGGYKWRYADAK